MSKPLPGRPVHDTHVQNKISAVPANIDNINLLSSISTEIFAENMSPQQYGQETALFPDATAVAVAHNIYASSAAAHYAYATAATAQNSFSPPHSSYAASAATQKTITTAAKAQGGISAATETKGSIAIAGGAKGSVAAATEPQAISIVAYEPAGCDYSTSSESSKAASKRTPKFLRQQWMIRYKELIQYKKQHKSCNVPQREKQLGCWVSTQRTQYKLMLEGRPSQMTQERIDLLNKIYFDWDPRKIFLRVYDPGVARANTLPEGPNRNDRKWMQWYHELVKFKECYEHCTVTRSANNSLGIWVQKQRKLYRDREKGKPSKILTDERVELLNDIEFVWELPPGSRPPKEKSQKPLRIPSLLEQRWHQRYDQLKEYKSQFGDCLVPEKKADFFKLGTWVSTQRKEGDSLPDYRKRLLDDLGFEWDVTSDGKCTKVWNQKLAELSKFKATNGHLNISLSDPATASLVEWMGRQRTCYQHLWAGKYSPLSEERIKILNQMCFGWNRQMASQAWGNWEEKFELLKKYKAEHGNCYVPINHPELGMWVDEQRFALKAFFDGDQSSLTWDQYSQLESVGFEFSVRASIPYDKSEQIAQ